MDLPPLTQRFVLHFGEMGSRWGINRTVGQIYALLYVSARPLNADPRWPPNFPLVWPLQTPPPELIGNG